MEIKKILLGDVCEIHGRVGWKGYSVEDLRETGPLVIGANDITPNNKLDLSSVKHLSREKYEESPEIYIQKGDILVVKIGSTIGKVALVSENIGEATINPNCVIVRPTTVSPLTVYYCLCLSTSKAFLINNSKASGQSALSQEALRKLPLFIPVEDNEKALSIITRIDSKIDNNNAIAAELEGMAKDLYDYWFVQFDFPDENGKPYKSSGGKMVWNEELKREIPEGWEYGNLYSIAEPINGLACQKYRPKNDEESLPVVKIKEMHTGITTDTERVSSNIPEKNKIFDGDILFSWSATLEVMFWFGGNAGLNQHIFKIVPINGYTKEYVYYQYSAYVINFVKMAEARKTTMGHITTDHLEQSRIILPPINVVQAFSKITAPIYEKIGTCKQECNDLASLRDFLLPMLMNGQVKVKGA